MVTEKISFSENHRALGVFITNETEILPAIEVLKLNFKRPVVVVVGGADKADDNHQRIIEKSARMIARAAAESQAIVLSGGTNSGVMAAMGRARAEGKYSFPLVGVAVKKLVTWPDDASSHNEAAPLEPHHTHFLLVPGNEWGDESLWMAKLATILAWEYPSVTVLSNGGEGSLKEVLLSIKAKRRLVVLEGTGRLADELAQTLIPSKLIKTVPANNKKAVFKTIHQSLVIPPRVENDFESADVTNLKGWTNIGRF